MTPVRFFFDSRLHKIFLLQLLGLVVLTKSGRNFRRCLDSAMLPG